MGDNLDDRYDVAVASLNATLSEVSGVLNLTLSGAVREYREWRDEAQAGWLQANSSPPSPAREEVRRLAVERMEKLADGAWKQFHNSDGTVKGAFAWERGQDTASYAADEAVKAGAAIADAAGSVGSTIKVVALGAGLLLVGVGLLYLATRE